MKNLTNQSLLYDKDCPMCNVYSSAFIKSGMLGKDGRENFSEMSEKNKLIIDYERAKNEIALVNHNNNTVAYGLDSLLLIIGNSFPLMEKIGRLTPVYWFFKKLYSFVSYNRKVIVPSSKIITEKSCVPTFNLKYRVCYLVFATLVSSLLIGKFLSQNFSANLITEKVFLFIAALICWQTVFTASLTKEKYFEYIGNLATVILIAALFIIPVLFLNFSIGTIYYFGTFLIFFIFFEHLRRSKLLKTGCLPNISLLLFFIFSFLLYYFLFI